MDISETVSHVVTVAGLVVPLASAAASLVNHFVRKAQAEGREVPKALLLVGSVLNVISVNLDKAVQLAKTAQTKPNVG